MPAIENPMVLGRIGERYVAPRVTGKCSYRYCDEIVHEGEGYDFDGQVYCSSTCIGEELIEVGAAVENKSA